MRAARPALLSLLAALTLAAVACDGEPRLSREAYERAMGQATRRFEAAFRELSESPELGSPGSPAALATGIREGAALLRRAAEDLAGLRPPEDAQAAHDRLARGLEDLAAAFEELASAVARGDLQGMRRFTAGAGDGTVGGMGAIREALRELRSLGYGRG